MPVNDHLARQDQERLGQDRHRTSERISELRQEHSGLAGRGGVLDGLIKSREGLGAGVREVIALIEQAELGPGTRCCVDRRLPIRQARVRPAHRHRLGDWAQRFIVCDILAECTEPLAGRVSFLPLLNGSAGTGNGVRAKLARWMVQLPLLSRVRQPGERGPTPDDPGLVAPTEHLVSCDHTKLGDLPAQLLGRNLAVHDLATAGPSPTIRPAFVW